MTGSRRPPPAAATAAAAAAILPAPESVGAALDAALEQALQQPALRHILAGPDGSAHGLDGEAAAAAVVDGLAAVVVTDLASAPAGAGGTGSFPAAVEQRRTSWYPASGRAAATRRAYLGAWRGFTAWCADTGRQPLPASPATVAAFLSSLSDTGVSLPTVVRHHAAIRHAHTLAGGDVPTGHPAVLEALAGIRRRLGPPPPDQPRPAIPPSAGLVADLDRTRTDQPAGPPRPEPPAARPPAAGGTPTAQEPACAPN